MEPKRKSRIMRRSASQGNACNHPFGTDQHVNILKMVTKAQRSNLVDYRKLLEITINEELGLQASIVL